MSELESLDQVSTRRPPKSDAAFRTISEVSQELDVPQHVLRFWEGRFAQIRPMKRGGGRRYYRPEDVQLLKRIRDLLYRDGYTIRGAQKLLRDPTAKVEGPGFVVEPAAPSPAAPPQSAAPAPGLALLHRSRPGELPMKDPRDPLLEKVLTELEQIRSLLEQARKGR